MSVSALTLNLYVFRLSRNKEWTGQVGESSEMKNSQLSQQFHLREGVGLNGHDGIVAQVTALGTSQAGPIKYQQTLKNVSWTTNILYNKYQLILD